MSQEIKPYEASGSKKEQVAKMFDNIAPRYDLLNRVLSLGIDRIWRKQAIEYLRPKAPRLILDVATGTADVALETARRLQPERIIGLDISSEMLQFGREKIHKQDMSHMIELQHGDSENLPFQDNTFDAITVAFGVRNFENLEKGLSEMHRVLKAGGQLVVLEFSKPRVFPLKQLFQFYFRYILPLVGRWTSRDQRAYSYLYESVQAFPEGDEFLNILQKTGYKSSQCKPLTFGICSIYLTEK
ncbi:MAG TPA: bifunctional demethylmenaquinone methyltransferase/2-methoxy-6-polyprenyl-1,4-benzoquinol methylase UbiE [Saprospiraceae bacterium]|nr:bifunctional demethylmenaquinone methyltransferase/2-methoxy-6-polyprenyl-1,4-benzoquinol methylase UbiE [Saprospiraceae bacterium]HMP14863.1 bifunctional demethylmenaquinone methyltransferase/2-methoxy-6-polyprenyl-1,4-benzoquinol methylase UbiE [Saprospiraceae bacterium]